MNFNTYYKIKMLTMMLPWHVLCCIYRFESTNNTLGRLTYRCNKKMDVYLSLCSAMKF